ncbi:hypothetical protein ACO0LO_26700 [Undibacterium sp. TJN25]|uniref:hypothetical protein n=1 Tax=Undibacterium sp. TJN25 TaxID=3413056 RepID=UPI003BF10941
MMEAELFEMTDRLKNPDQNTDEVRIDIADLITRGLSEFEYSLGYWEKTHYKLAISNLKKNIWLLDEYSTAYLGACLLCIAGAHVALEHRSVAFVTRDIETEALTWDDLMASIGLVRDQLH